MSKSSALFRTLLAGLSCLTLLMASPVNAQQSTPDFNAPIPTPSVPEFTLKYVDRSYDVPASTSTHTNPYTGEVTTTVREGYHVKNFTIDVIIKNQAFPENIDGHVLGMRYFIQTKGHYKDEWTERTVDTLSTSGYTIVSFSANSIPAGGVVDFRVKAWLGFYKQPMDNSKIGVPASFLWPVPSDWSGIQTIKIPNDSIATFTPNPTSSTTSSSLSPTAPSATSFTNLITFPLEIFITILVVVAFLVAMLTISLTRRHLKNDTLSGW